MRVRARAEHPDPPYAAVEPGKPNGFAGRAARLPFTSCRESSNAARRLPPSGGTLSARASLPHRVRPDESSGGPVRRAHFPHACHGVGGSDSQADPTRVRPRRRQRARTRDRGGGMLDRSRRRTGRRRGQVRTSCRGSESEAPPATDSPKGRSTTDARTTSRVSTRSGASRASLVDPQRCRRGHAAGVDLPHSGYRAHARSDAAPLRSAGLRRRVRRAREVPGPRQLELASPQPR